MCFTIKVNESVRASKAAAIARDWYQQNPDEEYVRLTVGHTSLSFKVIRREGASGKQVWVQPGTFNLKRCDCKPVKIEPISKTQFRFDRLFKTRSGKLDGFGLSLILFGLIINLSFLLGEVFCPIWVVSSSLKTQVTKVGSILIAIGTFVHVIRRVWYISE